MTDFINKEPVQRVNQKLKEFDQKLQIVVLENTAKTAADAANSLGTEIGSIVKSLLFKCENSFLLCLVAGDKRCSLNKIKKILNQKNVCMANANEVKSITGFTIGGVSPIGHKNDLKVFIDISLSRFSEVFAAAGHPHCIFKINFSKLKTITKGEVVDIIE
tara:strand:+ start:1164 stop:1646 length:483 start_codon:yes stop_codon:yes gene_type:complete